MPWPRQANGRPDLQMRQQSGRGGRKCRPRHHVPAAQFAFTLLSDLQRTSRDGKQVLNPAFLAAARSLVLESVRISTHILRLAKNEQPRTRGQSRCCVCVVCVASHCGTAAALSLSSSDMSPSFFRIQSANHWRRTPTWLRFCSRASAASCSFSCLY
jgi:hypothetical protein